MTSEILHISLTSQIMRLPLGAEFHTPDLQRSRRFILHSISTEHVVIQTQSGALVRLPIGAFVRIVVHLHTNNSTELTPARIGSSNLTPQVSGLCAIARGQNGRTRVINYILPILEQLGWVQTDGRSRPNVAWLNPSITSLDAPYEQLP